MNVKWCQEMNRRNKFFLEKIFRVHFGIACDISLIWILYRLLHKIIGIRKYLANIGKDYSSVCRLCTHDKETIVAGHVYKDVYISMFQ